MSDTATHSSTLCMVWPTSPNSTTGQKFLMNRASDVPPLVASAGCRPVTASTASERSRIRSSDRVRKTSEIVGSKVSVVATGGRSGRRSGVTVVARSTRCAISAFSVSAVQRSLKRMLKPIRTSAGMTLKVRLELSRTATSRFVGSNRSVPASSGGWQRAVMKVGIERTGLSARWG